MGELKIEHAVLDVPRDRFLIAGDAWVQCRAGKADTWFADLRTL